MAKGHFVGTNPNLQISQGQGPKMHIPAEKGLDKQNSADTGIPDTQIYI